MIGDQDEFVAAPGSEMCLYSDENVDGNTGEEPVKCWLLDCIEGVIIVSFRNH